MPETSEYHDGAEAVWIVYDLSDPGQWRLAGQCVRCWGRERVMIYTLDAERVVVEYKLGGTADVQEPA